jgi:hypothetical protein
MRFRARFSRESEHGNALPIARSETYSNLRATALATLLETTHIQHQFTGIPDALKLDATEAETEVGS